MAVTKLVLVRHGESQWNQENRFTGWYDVDLSDKGRTEAKAAGKLLKEEVHFRLRLHLRTEARDPHPVEHPRRAGSGLVANRKSWKLNERHYGALQGLNKAETAENTATSK